MNSVVNRRRVYNEPDTIKLPNGYKVAKYFDCKSDVMVSKIVQIPRTAEALIEPDITKYSRVMFGRAGNFAVGNHEKKVWSSVGNSTASYFAEATPAVLKVYHNSNNSCKVYVDGVDVGLSGTTAHSNLGIFGVSSGYEQGFYGKVYWVKIYKNGAVIHHIIPCKKGDISAAFDLITNSFVTPTSGSFHVV